MHIALLIADNRYATTKYFAKGLQNALEKLGVKVTSHEVQASGLPQLLDAFELECPDWTFSFSDLTCGGVSLGTITQIPHFSYLLDPAALFVHHMQGEYSALSCVDRTDVEFVKNMGFERVCYLPHAVESLFPPAIPWDQREYDLVYFGSCLDVEQLLGRWDKDYSCEQCSLLKRLAHQALMTSGVLWEILVHAKVAYEQFLTFYREIDEYVRAQDRLKLLAALPADRLTIWGEGPWQRYLPHARCYPAVDFAQTLELIRKAKVVINSSARFKQGYHERIFYAFASSTLVLTSYSPQIAQDFSAKICYQQGAWEDVCETLHELEQHRVPLLAQAQHIILQKHSWDQRALQLLTLFKQWHCGQRATV